MVLPIINYAFIQELESGQESPGLQLCACATEASVAVSSHGGGAPEKYDLKPVNVIARVS